MTRITIEIDGDGVRDEREFVWIANHRWPGGIWIVPPTIEGPWWSTAEGERFSVRTMLEGQEDVHAGLLIERHASAVSKLVWAVDECPIGREGDGCRRFVARATRLSNDLGGFTRSRWGLRCA